MRTYLVVIDDSDESWAAQRFAARRAARTGGNIHLVSAFDTDFVAWGGVQATIEAEAREQAEAVARAAADALGREFNLSPNVTVARGEIAAVVRALLSSDNSIAALVLGAAAAGNPGPLVSHFTGNDAGTLPVPVMIIPGGLALEEIDRLS